MTTAAQKENYSALQHTTFVQPDFYINAAQMRRELEEKLSITSGAGITPLMYVFSRNRYQFLTASSEHVFTQAILDDVIEKLGAWAGSMLGALHVSTPQVRCYVRGCSRELVSDKIGGQWHYVLPLTPDQVGDCRLKILQEAGGSSQRIGLGQMERTRLQWNTLIVHRIASAYGIEFAGKSMDPLEAAVFLDGYFW